jgi:ADP-ribose pyrophosphatase
MPHPERIERRSVFDGRIVKLSVDRVRLPNGRIREMEMIRHPGAAAVVPLDQRGHVILVRQYRYASGGWLLEVPAGKLDGDELPERCARREVEEETGCSPGTLIPMGWIWTTPGFTDEKIWLYLARDLAAGTQSLQDDEILTPERLPFDEALAMASRGEIHDSKTVCALFRAQQFLRAR